MTTFLLWMLTVQCLAILGWGLVKKERMIQFPFLAAAVFAGWVLPQLVGLTNNSNLPPGALAKTIFMAILCLGAGWWGYTANWRPAQLFQWQFNRNRLLLGSAVLSLLGALFYYLVSFLAADVTAEFGGQWTGIITIYSFFAQLLTFGLVIALILHLNRPGWPTLLIILFDLAFYLERIVIKGRRAELVELGLILLMALWFYRRRLPPRWAIVGAILVGALVVNSIGDYRSVMLGEDRTTWSGAGVGEILEIDYIGNLRQVAQGTAESRELTNAVLNIEATDRLKSFDVGLSIWNNFVHSYVPGQLLGPDFKRDLMVDFGNAAFTEFRHTPYTGTTSTGLSDSFMSFWYFGAIKFFFIGLIMSRWYRAAARGHLVAQMILMLTITASLLGLTHSTHWFFTGFVQMAAFLLPVLVLARVGERRYIASISNLDGRVGSR